MEFQSSSEWRTPPRVCRCCLSEGCYKDISSEYYWMGEKEIYAEMLKECFDLTLSMKDVGSNGCLICEVCITRLRDASNFKKQVVTSEKRFFEHLKTGTSLAELTSGQDKMPDVKIEFVKDEAVISDDDPPDPNDVDFDDDDYDESDSLPLKFEVQKKESLAELSFGDEIPALNPEMTIRKVATKSKDSKVLKKLKMNKKELTIKPVKASGSKDKKEPKVRAKITKPAKKGDPSDGSEHSLFSKSKEGTGESKPMSSAEVFKMFNSHVKVIHHEINIKCELTDLEETIDKPERAENDVSDQIKIEPDKVLLNDSRQKEESSKAQLKVETRKRHLPKSKGLDINSKKRVDINSKKRVDKSKKSIIKTKSEAEIKKRAIRSGIKKCYDILDDYSNVTLFKIKGKLLRCYYCFQTFVRADNLREHNQSKESHKKWYIASDFHFNVDITDLKCKVCHYPMDSLVKFKDHVITRHGVKVPEEFDKYVIPFKLNDSSSCVLCEERFPTFVNLNQHMDIHFPNFMCRVCGKQFASLKRLEAHELNHRQGEFKCKHCPKTFTRNSTRYNHQSLKTCRCFECDIVFEFQNDYYSHRKTKHNVDDSDRFRHCESCSRTFSSEGQLKQHLRRVHLRELLINCTLCDKKFYNNKSLKFHMLKHTGQRDFTCDVCNKSFLRKFTLTEHMRIHNNDKRFKCTVCSAAFTYKCSLRSHLKAHHPGVVLD